MIRVLLADDQALVRGGFRSLLEARDDIEVVGEAATVRRPSRRPGRSARRGAHGHPHAGAGRPGSHPPDRRRSPAGGVRVIILTTFGLDEYLFDALRYGASGFLVKDTEPADLVTAVRVVAAGDSLISPGMTRRLVEEFAARAKPSRPASELAVLTGREREVLGLVAGGLTNDEIGDASLHEPGHRPHACQPRHDQARRPRPYPARRAGLRDRAGPPGMARLTMFSM